MEFSEVINKVYFFHLSQSAWRKIQQLELKSNYSLNEEFSLKIRQMLALAFLPPKDITNIFDKLKPEIS